MTDEQPKESDSKIRKGTPKSTLEQTKRSQLIADKRVNKDDYMDK